MEHPVVPVFRGKPELPLHHRPTTASHTEGLHPWAVVGAVVGPELPLGQQFLGGGDPGGTTALITGSTGLFRTNRNFRATTGLPPNLVQTGITPERYLGRWFDRNYRNHMPAVLPV